MRERSVTDVADAVIARHQHTVDECPGCSQIKSLGYVVSIGKGIFVLVCSQCRVWRGGQGWRP